MLESAPMPLLHVLSMIGKGAFIVFGALLLLAVVAANLYILAMAFYAVMGHFVHRNRS